jgi:hypothetical protein
MDQLPDAQSKYTPARMHWKKFVEDYRRRIEQATQ